MKSLAQHIISGLSVPLPLKLLKGGKKPFLLPFYHTVGVDEKHPFRFNYELPSTERFKADLDFLLKHFKPVTLDDLVSGKQLKNCFHLSFDDGLRTCYEIIAPILKEKGVPATFFINPAFADNQDLFHRYKASILLDFIRSRNLNIEIEQTYADLASLDQLAEDMGINWENYLKEEQPYMGMEQLKSLQADGFTLGAHSWDHPEFWLLDEERQLEEIRESMNWLEKHFSPKIRAFAFPFTDWGVPDPVFEKMKEENLCDISFGTAGLKKDPINMHFQRIAMDAPLGKSARSRIKVELLAYRIKRLLNQHIARR